MIIYVIPYQFYPTCIIFNLFKSIKELESWDGQSPPTARTYKGKPVIALKDILGNNQDSSTPNFGPYSKQKRELMTTKNSEQKDLLGNNKVSNQNRPANVPDKKISAVADVIGRALDHIGTYSDLDNRYY